MLLIGLGYKARQGKDTAALAMLEVAPIAAHAKVYKFADALRKEVTKACHQMGGADNLIEGFKSIGKMPDWVVAEQFPNKQRTLLQWWGTDYRRKDDPNYWIKRLFQTFTEVNPDIAFVTDVRFPNEADAIKAAGGYLIEVARTGGADVEVHPHESELAMDGYYGWDYRLLAKDKAELVLNARAMYVEIARKHRAFSRP